jgi:CheY-like chemotaxis protein
MPVNVMAMPAPIVWEKTDSMISVAKRAVILIVEDELLIRMHAVEMIEESFEVVEAASADEAIAILEARLDISVVFTDI